MEIVLFTGLNNSFFFCTNFPIKTFKIKSSYYSDISSSYTAANSLGTHPLAAPCYN